MALASRDARIEFPWREPMQRKVPTTQATAGSRAHTLAGASFLIVGLAAYCGVAKAQSLPATDTIAIPTYEAAGLYWQNPGGTAGCEVKYRKSTDSAWSQGLAMWYDARDS